MGRTIPSIESMKIMLLKRRGVKSLQIYSLISALLFSTLVTVRAQEQAKLPAPTSHLNDNAGVIAAADRQQLENILNNLQLRSGLNFTVLTLKTTGGRDIFDVSVEIARDWGLGTKESASKSLLLVISVNEKVSFAQFSRKAQKDIPEGALGEMNQRMRASMNAGRVTEALTEGLRPFIAELSGRMGFSTDGMDQAAPVQSAQTEPSPVAGDSTAAVVSATPADDTKSATPTEKPAEKAAEKSVARNTRKNPTTEKSPSANAKPNNTPVDDEAEAEEVEVTLTLPFAARVNKLMAFLAAHPDSKSKTRATELLIVARAALGDERLKAGDNAAGIQQLSMAIAATTPEMSEKLFAGVIAQIPLNLYLRGEGAEAINAANAIEAKVGNNPKRLLALSGFYVETERGEEAARLAEQAIKLAPDMAAAHYALAVALHISLRLDEAAAEYKRTLDLDPKTPAARRSLADLDRAAGKFSEALALYREQLVAASDDKGARTGLVLSLYELGQTAEADQEFEAARKDDPRNLNLLAGTAYWLLAHNNSRRALDLAQRAADLEPRYTWGQIALARALIAEKNPIYAERSLRFVRQYGKFATLDYELANTLAALGLYEEAAEVLVRAFTIRDGFIETKLAGKIPARASGFIELLAPERRASIFQSTAADTENNARTLKGLLAFTQVMNPGDESAKIDEATATAAAREFAAGNDDMRAYRQLYAAGSLLQHGIGYQAAQELADAARDAADAALRVPAVTVAVQADELREIRARAIAAGGTPDIPEAPRNVLASILRGRIEELSGWALFNQDKTSDAIERLRRAVGVLPEQTPLWRTAVWHLGAALQQNGNSEEALGYYIKNYSTGAPDPVRRMTIEQLYRKVNGSLDGLDDRIGPSLVTSTVTPPTSSPASPAPASDQLSSDKATLPAASPTPGPTPTPEPPAAQTAPVVESAKPAASPEASPEATPSPSPESSPTPEASPKPSPEETPATVPSATPTPTPESRRTQVPTPTPTPSPAPASDSRPRRVKPPRS
jgi:uncharacterized membrane protein YgcG/tetratricopeptide (TPR) repeat protein